MRKSVIPITKLRHSSMVFIQRSVSQWTSRGSSIAPEQTRGRWASQRLHPEQRTFSRWHRRIDFQTRSMARTWCTWWTLSYVQTPYICLWLWLYFEEHQENLFRLLCLIGAYRSTTLRVQPRAWQYCIFALWMKYPIHMSQFLISLSHVS